MGESGKPKRNHGGLDGQCFGVERGNELRPWSKRYQPD
jgi:hypothetical protein